MLLHEPTMHGSVEAHDVPTPRSRHASRSYCPHERNCVPLQVAVLHSSLQVGVHTPALHDVSPVHGIMGPHS